VALFDYGGVGRVPPTEQEERLGSKRTRHRLTLSDDHTQLFLDEQELKHVIGYEIKKTSELPKNTAELTVRLKVEY